MILDIDLGCPDRQALVRVGPDVRQKLIQHYTRSEGLVALALMPLAEIDTLMSTFSSALRALCFGG
jgi:hypothetical protein